MTITDVSILTVLTLYDYFASKDKQDTLPHLNTVQTASLFQKRYCLHFPMEIAEMQEHNMVMAAVILCVLMM